MAELQGLVINNISQAEYDELVANNAVNKNEIYIIKDKKITAEQLPQILYYNYQLGSSAAQSEIITTINQIAALFGAIPYEAPVYDYTINIDNETNISSVTITGLTNTSTTELEIPKLIQRLPVTSIDTTVTSTTNPEYNNVTKLSVYDNITDIGSSFKNAKNLTDVTVNIPTTESVVYNLRSRTINGLVELKAEVFSGCEKLSSFNGGEQITSIGPSAFANTKLTTIPTQNITSIPDYAFYNTLLSGDLTLSNCISIGQCAFYGKNKLESIEILEPCETIGPSAFFVSANTALKSIKLPSTIKSIGRCAFDWLTYVSNDFDFSTFNNLETIDSWAFSQCKLVSAINLPLNGKLTAINEGAFYSCNNISTLTIPSTVQTIGQQAFYTANIKKLTDLDIGGSALTSVGASAFGVDCNISALSVGNIVSINNTYLGNTGASTTLKKLVITDACSAIVSSAFNNCVNVSSRTLGKNIKSIGQQAFFRLSNCIDPLIIPSSVTSIGPSAFFDNYKIPSIEFEEGCELTSISNNAFSFCKSLTAINFPKNIQSLGISAFCNCSTITSLNIPSSITSVGTYCFQNNRFQSISAYNNFQQVSSIISQAKATLTGLNVYNTDDTKFGIANSLFYNWTTLKDIYFDPVVTSIGASAFYNCTTLTSITIPNSVSSIGSLAFYGCSSLTSITIPEPITTINQTVFMNCQKLVEINLPSTLTTIGLSAFRQCFALPSINLPSSLTTIQANVFMQCNSLKSITFDKTMSQVAAMSNKYWGIPSGAQISCTDGIITVTGSNTGTAKGYPTVITYTDGTTSSIVNDDGVLTYQETKGVNIGSDENTTIKSVVIGTDTSSISSYAFAYCKSLSLIEIPNSVLSIGDNVFDSCTSLTSVTIPNSVSNIGYAAFRTCTSLSSIEIPTSVISIGTSTFSGCSSLTSIEIPKTIKSIGGQVFTGCYSLLSIEIPEIVETIGVYEFECCSSLTSVFIPSSVTSISYRGFGHCHSLSSIEIPNSVSSIGSGAFEYCSSLTSVTYNKPMSEISSMGGKYWSLQIGTKIYASDGIITVTENNTETIEFPYTIITYTDDTTSPIVNDDGILNSKEIPNKSEIKSVIIGTDTLRIDTHTFERCSLLTSIEIPETVESIGNYSFDACYSLLSIEIPNSLTSIGDGAFYCCSSLTSTTIPSSVTKMGWGVFNGCSSLTSVTFDKPMSEISSMSNKYWYLETGCKIYTSDGIITVTGSDTGSLNGFNEPTNPS